MDIVPRNWLYSAGIFAAVLVLMVNIVSVQRQEPWEDEVFAVSTSWSLARAEPPNLSVLSQYPGTASPILFYGPVSFEAEAWLIRFFGLSPGIWRLACSCGVLLSVFASQRLVKLAGGGRWEQLITILLIAFAASLGGTLPGRWDAVSTGLFLTGLLIFFAGNIVVGRPLLARSVMAGVFIGFSLASTPRALTLTMAAMIALLATGLCVRKSRAFFLGSLVIASTVLLTQTLLLLPWHENSISWYRYVKRATSADYINATPLTGRGSWTLDLHHHKMIALLVVVLILVSVYSAITQRSRLNQAEMPLKVFLTIFATVNLAVTVLVLTNALGQGTFWLPSAIVANMCWINRETFRQGWGGAIAASLIGGCLLLFCLEEIEQTAAVLLTWNQRSIAAMTAFAKRSIPAGAAVYGPIGGYFYSVELAGHRYLYPYERTTPGLYSKTPASIATKLDEEICSQHTYLIWPKQDFVHHPEEQTMPAALSERLRKPVAEFDQPVLAGWKEGVLDRMGEIGGKYGFPDLVLYSLGSRNCKEG